MRSGSGGDFGGVVVELDFARQPDVVSDRIPRMTRRTGSAVQPRADGGRLHGCRSGSSSRVGVPAAPARRPKVATRCAAAAPSICMGQYGSVIGQTVQLLSEPPQRSRGDALLPVWTTSRSGIHRQPRRGCSPGSLSPIGRCSSESEEGQRLRPRRPAACSRGRRRAG